MSRRKSYVLFVALPIVGCADYSANDSPSDRASEAPSVTTDAALESPICPDFNPSKNVYWGDLHGHTTYSLDAFASGDRTDPAGAYAFAAGIAPVTIAGAGSPSGPVVGPLSPKLDFAAITDHSEFLGEVYGCTDTSPENASFYGSTFCGDLRNQGSAGQVTVALLAGSDVARANPTPTAECIAHPLACPRETFRAWRNERLAVHAAYNPCTFTSLVGYEWTANPNGNNLHRNVIFGTEDVPEVPFDYLSYPTAQALWSALETSCTGNCRALTIPHNSNASGGAMFATDGFTPADLANMVKYQRLVEIFQHKGNSECWSDTSDTGNDVQCDYELLPKSIAAGDRAGYVRSALEKGLADYSANVAGPKVDDLQLGVIGSTDTHNATQGNVAESTFPGHLGGADDTALARLRPIPSPIFGAPINFNPGGVAAVWAEQNTRDSIFAALQRREVFATSGPRIAVRFYAYAGSDDPCTDPGFPAKVIADGGVPMGGSLAPPSAAPRFVVYALKDKTDLLQVEIFKASYPAGATSASEASYVFSAAVAPGGRLGGSVSGSRACVTWQDPSYDASAPSLYYARILEQPTKRWSTYDCATVKADRPLEWPSLAPGCACQRNGQTAVVTVGSGPFAKTHTIACDSVKTGILDVTQSERAWSSPIWILP